MDEVAVGEERVTDARRRVGEPHEGQNLREESLQILCSVSVLSVEYCGVYFAVRNKSKRERYALETCMTSQHPSFHPLNLLTLHTNQRQPHLQQNILHRKIRRHTTCSDLFSL